jgi:hypothetical protein
MLIRSSVSASLSFRFLSWTHWTDWLPQHFAWSLFPVKGDLLWLYFREDPNRHWGPWVLPFFFDLILID